MIDYKNLNPKLPYQAYIVAGALLLLAAASMPYGYYTFVRIAVCGLASVNAYHSLSQHMQNKSIWPWLFLLVAILFNPFVVIHMQKEAWMLADISVGLLFFFIAYKIRNNQTSGDKLTYK